MHIGNHEFLEHLNKQYPDHFTRSRVLELGSKDLNGTVRDHFVEPVEFVGIDISPGKCVDLVVAAKDTVFEPDHFDVLITMSMIEHDPDWRESLTHNMQWLRSGGLFVMCWGAEGNPRHPPEPWALVPVEDMRQHLTTLPLDDVDMFFEGDRFRFDCLGAWDVVARKR